MNLRLDSLLGCLSKLAARDWTPSTKSFRGSRHTRLLARASYRGENCSSGPRSGLSDRAPQAAATAPPAELRKGALNSQTESLDARAKPSMNCTGGAHAVSSGCPRSGHMRRRVLLGCELLKVLQGGFAVEGLVWSEGIELFGEGADPAVGLVLGIADSSSSQEVQVSTKMGQLHLPQRLRRRVRIPVKLNAGSGEREHGFRRT